MSDDSNRIESPPDPLSVMEEGTEELDQAALMRRLQADSRDTQPVARSSEPGPVAGQEPPHRFGRPPSDMRDTVQSPPVVPATVPVVSKPPDPTQHYTVPEELLAQGRLPSRAIPTAVRNLPTIPIEAIVMDGEGTATFSTADILEFDSMVDKDGRVALPDSALRGHYRPGTRVKVIIVPDENQT